MCSKAVHCGAYSCGYAGGHFSSAASQAGRHLGSFVPCPTLEPKQKRENEDNTSEPFFLSCVRSLFWSLPAVTCYVLWRQTRLKPNIEPTWRSRNNTLYLLPWLHFGNDTDGNINNAACVHFWPAFNYFVFSLSRSKTRMFTFCHTNVYSNV